MTQIKFSNDEIAKGKDITKKYADLYAYAIVLQETVKKATESLSELAKSMDEVKSEEIEFFFCGFNSFNKIKSRLRWA